MAQLRQEYSKFVAKGAEIIIVGPEPASVFRDYFKRESLPFVGLPDVMNTVLRRYGQEINLFKLGRMPAQVIIDHQGIVRYVHYGHEMSDIPANDELLQILDELNQTMPAQQKERSAIPRS